MALDESEKEQIIRLTSGADAIAPEILPYEIGNALSALIKRKQLTREEAFSAQRVTSAIPVRLISVDIQQALNLTIKFNIYAYDAYFLQCAKFLSCPLMTLDRRMKQIAIELNINRKGVNSFFLCIELMVLLWFFLPLGTFLSYPLNLLGIILIILGIGIAKHGSNIFGQAKTNIQTFEDLRLFNYRWAF